MERIQSSDPDEQRLINTVYDHDQGQIFRWWGDLDAAGRSALLAQVRTFDFDELDRLIETHLATEAEPFQGTLEPPDTIPVPSTDAQVAARQTAREAGEALLQAGKVAAFLVAGGQGTRLGFDGPKGAYPISPVKSKTLFQLFAERIIATEARTGAPVPWFIMVSETNQDETEAFFEANDYFGLSRNRVQMFCQRMIPALGTDGKLILDGKGHVFTNPNGHGGSLLALRDSRALEQMQTLGIEQIFYFQVDNVLCRVLDPVYLGYHALAGADMSCKVVRKTDPAEKVGLIGRVDGKLGCIEYSDISKEQNDRLNPDGSLVFSAGNIAIHLLRAGFVAELTGGRFALPYHKAVKKIEHLDQSGNRVQPAEPNGIKLETFVFDALGFAAKSVVMEVERADEFAPVKNAEGSNSPTTARAAQTQMHTRWLKAAGVTVPRDAGGASGHPIEISPGFALDEQELAAKVDPAMKIDGPVFLA